MAMVMGLQEGRWQPSFGHDMTYATNRTEIGSIAMSPRNQKEIW